jgi:hypothetical protein
VDILTGTIRAYDAGTHTATVEIDGATDAFLAAIPVSRGIAGAEVTAGRRAAVLFTDAYNPAEAMVLGVY